MKIMGILLLLLISSPISAAINPKHSNALNHMGYAGKFGFTRAGSLEWYGPGSPPTEAQADAAMLAGAKAERKRKIRPELRRKILSLYSLEYLVFAALGILSNSEKDAMKAALLPIVLDAKNAKTAIEGLSTVALVEAFAW